MTPQELANKLENLRRMGPRAGLINKPEQRSRTRYAPASRQEWIVEWSPSQQWAHMRLPDDKYNDDGDWRFVRRCASYREAVKLCDRLMDGRS